MNLYWSIYENLENETLNIADNIFFDDTQLKVYSLNIATLIIRCAIEIEAISKELYCRLGGVLDLVDKKTKDTRPPFFDTECLALINDKWKVNLKELQISSIKMNFSHDKAILKPLHKSDKRGSSGSKWKQAYQAIKHDRANNLKVATVENLLNALGALYILNQYYKEESFWSDVPIEGKDAYTPQSKIFSPFIFDVSTHLSLNPSYLPDEKSLYVKKYTDDIAIKFMDLMYQYNFSLWTETVSSEQFFRYMQENPMNVAKIDVQFMQTLGLDINSLLKNFKASNISLPADFYRHKELVLNKNQPIYPERTLENFYKTPVAKQMLADAILAFTQWIK